MRLFDDIARTDADPAGETVNHFDYLNTSAREEADKIRMLLEDWFRRYPQEGHSQLRARFRAKGNHEFLSAFFELYLYQLLSSFNYKVLLNDLEGGKRRPDFYVIAPDGPDFYLEATVAKYVTKATPAETRTNQLLDELNTLKSDGFFLSLDIEGSSATMPSASRLKREVAAFLKDLDPDKVTELYADGGSDALPMGEFIHENLTIYYRPLPKKREARGQSGHKLIGMHGPAEAYLVNDHTALKDAICGKAGRYGELEKPYIVAVNVAAISLEFTDIMNALFGDETYIVPATNLADVAVLESTRKGNGAWVLGNKPRNTRVSAVVVVSNLDPWVLAQKKPIRAAQPIHALP